jgi:hypothetical protein
MDRIRAKAWMAGTSPAMTQVIEIYKYRYAWPRAGHPRGAAGTAVFTEFGHFFRILLEAHRLVIVVFRFGK